MIDIATVLSKLNDTFDERTHQEKYYGIRFLDRHGNTHEVTVRKNVKSPQLKQDVKRTRGKDEFNLQRQGTVLLAEHNAIHPITPKACMIYGFRDFQSNKWLNVFH
jgi:hypothetical protein